MATNITLQRNKVVFKRRGRSRSSHYKDIEAGLFPPPIPIGDRAVATPDFEVDTMIAAQVAGKSPEELRVIVKELVASRKEYFERMEN